MGIKRIGGAKAAAPGFHIEAILTTDCNSAEKIMKCLNYRPVSRMGARLLRLSLICFAAASAAGFTQAQAQSVTTLIPTSYTTTQGSTGGQSVSTLGIMDESGLANDWNNYIEFYGQSVSTSYTGYTSYTLPTSITPTSVTSIQVQADYRGPSTPNQVWTWKIYDWVHGAYVTIGDNTFAPSWGSWKVLNFNVWGNLANYIRTSDGAIRVQLLSNNSADNANIDYEAVVVTSNSGNPTTNNSYFVSKSGNDSNPGTQSSPWLTIQHAANTVGPGSTVYVESGVYNELLTYNVCGSASGGLIRFQNYPGQTAIIDGTGVTIPYSTDSASRGLVQITNCSYVTLEGFVIRNVTPNTSSVFPAAISINGNSSYVQVRGNTVYNVNNSTYGAHAIGVYGNSSSGSNTGMVIDGNQIHDLVLGFSEAVHIDGNVENFAVTNNQVYNANNIGIDVLGGYGTSPLVDQARNGVISGNLVYNDTDSANPVYTGGGSASGIYVDGGAGVVVEGNISHDNDIGIQVASEKAGKVASNVTVRNNVIYHNRVSGLSIGGYSTGVGSATNSAFVNNSLFQNASLQNGIGEVNLQYFPTTVSGNVFANNVVYTNAQDRVVTSWINTPRISMNYDVYYPSTGLTSSSWVWNSNSYGTLAAWTAATGNDANSIYANPNFVQTTYLPPEMFPNTGSPLLSAGTNLGSSVVGTVDFNGHPRVSGSTIDIGAYQATQGAAATTYLADSSANTLAGGAVVQTCSGCADGHTVGFIGNGGTLQFNNVSSPTTGTHTLTISYEDGDAGRAATLTVNGTATTVSFTGLNNGNWNTPQTKTVSVTLNAGSSNTIKFSNASGWAPDIDLITIQ